MNLKFMCITTILVLLCFCVHSQRIASNTSAPPSPVYNDADDIVRFVLDFYRYSYDGTKNFVMSPLAIRIMVSLFYYQSRGQTNADLQNYFYFNENKNKLLEFHRRALEIVLKDKHLKVINKVYVNRNYEVNDEFKNILFLYKCFLESIDVTRKAESARKVNRWIENETNGLIRELVDADTFSSDMVVLGINTMYFKAKWLEPFTRGRLEDFYQLNGQVVQVQTMTDSGDFMFAKVPEINVEVLEIHYEEGSNYVFWLMLPKEGTSLTELVQNLNYNNFKLIESKMREASMDVVMPIFETETEIDCKEVLERTGLHSIFQYRNEIPILKNNTNIMIDEMKQKTKIIVNTDGTEVASGTYTKFTLLSAKPLFRVNRPFLYAILTQSTRVPIFMGHYLEVK